MILVCVNIVDFDNNRNERSKHLPVSSIAFSGVAKKFNYLVVFISWFLEMQIILFVVELIKIKSYVCNRHNIQPVWKK